MEGHSRGWFRQARETAVVIGTFFSQLTVSTKLSRSCIMSSCLAVFNILAVWRLQTYPFPCIILVPAPAANRLKAAATKQLDAGLLELRHCFSVDLRLDW